MQNCRSSGFVFLNEMRDSKNARKSFSCQFLESSEKMRIMAGDSKKNICLECSFRKL